MRYLNNFFVSLILITLFFDESFLSQKPDILFYKLLYFIFIYFNPLTLDPMMQKDRSCFTRFETRANNKNEKENKIKK